MRVETFLGRRHLFGREGWLRVRLTTAIAITSVAVGVAALIIVLALLDGLDAAFHQKWMELMAHVEVLPPDGARQEIFDDPASVGDWLAQDPRVVASAPEVAREAFLLPDRDIGGTRMAVQLLGVDPEQMRPVAAFADRTRLGREPASGEIVLGQLLAEALRVVPGDSVWAITRLAFDANAMPHFRTVELRVADIFTTDIPELDLATAYVSLPTARRIFLLPEDAASRFLVRIENPYAARAVARALSAEATHPAGIRLRSWDETNAEFFHALRLEKVGTFVMLLMIVLVGAFNIIGTLVMIVTERTREIGILKTMGAPDALVRRIFLRSGLVIGLLGTGLGLAAGLAACFALARVRFNLPTLVYNLDRLPILVHWQTVALIIACSLAICLAASVLPAQTAARLDPVEALRRD